MMTLNHDDIEKLNPPERLALIAELWDSITDAEVPMSSAQRRELDRRLATFEQDSSHVVSWDDARY